MEALVVVPGIILGLSLYFLPTITAGIRRKNNTRAIFVLNFLTGWTLVGWIIALVWAVTVDKPET